MIIIGAKGFAKEVLEILMQNHQIDNLAFFDNVSAESENLLYNQFPIFRSFEEAIDFFNKSGDRTFTIGMGNPVNRYKVYRQFLELGGQFASTISPYARIGHFGNKIDEGCNIMTGTVITNSVTIDKGVLINLNCTVGHDCKIGEFVEMSPGTHISGNCEVGRFSVFGTNSTVLPKIKIGSNVIVGAGAVVTKDVPDNSLIVGIPGKVLKELPPLDF